MLRVFDKHVFAGNYTIGLSCDSFVVLSDGRKNVAQGEGCLELLEFLARHKCTGVEKRDGVMKLKFDGVKEGDRAI